MLVRPLAVVGALVVLGALTRDGARLDPHKLRPRPRSSASTSPSTPSPIRRPGSPRACTSSRTSPNNSLSCNTTFDVFRSYLYDPQTHRGWTVERLVGPLRNATGKHFVGAAPAG